MPSPSVCIAGLPLPALFVGWVAAWAVGAVLVAIGWRYANHVLHRTLYFALGGLGRLLRDMAPLTRGQAGEAAAALERAQELCAAITRLVEPS